MSVVDEKVETNLSGLEEDINEFMEGIDFNFDIESKNVDILRFDDEMFATQNESVRHISNSVGLVNLELSQDARGQSGQSEMNNVEGVPMSKTELSTPVGEVKASDIVETGFVLNSPHSSNNIEAANMEFDLVLFGMKWKFGPVVKNWNGQSMDVNGLVPCEDSGKPIHLLLYPSAEGNSAEPCSPSSQGTHISTEDEDVMKDGSDNIFGPENLNPDPVLHKMDEQVLTDPPVSDENSPFSNVSSTEIVNISNGSENTKEVVIIEPNNDNHDRRVKGGEVENPKAETDKWKSVRSECVNNFMPETFKNGKFCPNPNSKSQKAMRAAKLFAPLKIEKILMPKSPIPGRTVGSSFKFLCQFCEAGFQQYHRWSKHVLVHTGENVYKCLCDKCGIPYRDIRTMRKHHNEAHM